MTLTASLITELFKGFTVQRWNDKIRTVELLEIDKHAHKMFIAFILGKYEELEDTQTVNWHDIIKGGIYELLRRIVISDIKSPIFYKIKQDYPETFMKLNEWVFERIRNKFNNKEIEEEFHQFLLDENFLDPFAAKILHAAHIYASNWEFQKIIKQANPDGYQINSIERDLLAAIDSHLDLIGIQKLITRRPISDFIDLCGQLRFQIRWSQTPRLPKTSVLGHSMFVAVMSYFFARDNHACDKRLYNDFFGGLFHDLPEAVTRDIISPVKMSSVEFMELIQHIEVDLADKEIMPLLEKEWQNEIQYFTRDEFSNKIIIDGNIERIETVEELNTAYNTDKYNPIDGKLIKTADRLAAFIEAWTSVGLGIRSEELVSACQSITEKFGNEKTGNLNLKDIYSGFEID
jgi:putative hydrolase of HD superfamily